MTLWDIASRERLGTLQGQSSRGIHPEVAFANDGRTMASVVGGGGLMLWDLSVEGWRKAACAVGNRDLSRAEWERYVGPGFAARSTCRSNSKP